jgi:arylsulfatase A-like enzyme
MKKWLNGMLTAGCCFSASASAFSAQSEPSRPNVVVILTDDQGYADLGVQGMVDDVRTPHLDRLAAEGVRFTHGYVTAPVCGPSRAGLLTGRYQQRMGVESNVDMPFELDTEPFPERLRRAGYRTGMTGKLHVPTKGANDGEDPRIWGFEEYGMRAGDFIAAPNRRLCTHDPDGNPLPDRRWMEIEGYRLDVTSDFAVRFIDRNHDHPFFLYVSYLGPHTPIEATEEYLSRFPDVTPPARRYGLAMISAIDDGVGRIMDKLKEYGIDENTLVIFLSDHGAPLRGKRDLPIDQLEIGEWNGSLNDPMLAEKDMIGEGGIRVPFLLRWPGRVPPGQVVDTPVISLDIAATAMALNGLDATDLDGENLMPLVTGEVATIDRNLYWMISGQTAVRKGKWKLLQTAHHGPYLFDVSLPEPERVNHIAHYPEIAAGLQKELDQWKADIGRRGIHRNPQIKWARELYDTHYGETE